MKCRRISRCGSNSLIGSTRTRQVHGISQSLSLDVSTDLPLFVLDSLAELFGLFCAKKIPRRLDLHLERAWSLDNLSVPEVDERFNLYGFCGSSDCWLCCWFGWGFFLQIVGISVNNPIQNFNYIEYWELTHISISLSWDVWKVDPSGRSCPVSSIQATMFPNNPKLIFLYILTNPVNQFPLSKLCSCTQFLNQSAYV